MNGRRATVKDRLRTVRVTVDEATRADHRIRSTLPDAEAPSRDYVDRLMALGRGLNDEDTKWIVTEDRIAGVPCPSVVVADRWGEVAHVAHPSQVQDLPAPEELFEWVRYLEYRCPECEGEAR